MSTDQIQDVSSRIDELPDLLPIPEVALRLMNACKDVDVGARELCRIVACDPSLSVRLLRVSNSSLYGCSGQIKTIEHAAVVLGVRGLRDLAVSIVAAGLFEGEAAGNKSVDLLWKHSLGCATVAKIISECVDGVCPDEAFLSGMVHDVGKLVLVQLLKDEYELIPVALAGESVVETEMRLYGVSHAELGARCVEEWGLPFEIGDALRNHHCPNESEGDSPLASVVNTANQFCKTWNIGSEDKIDIDCAAVAETNGFAFDASILEDFRDRSPVEFARNCQTFES